jgi:periplasmic protein TonB
MRKDLKIVPDFDEIVFRNRNKEYGAYLMRKRYSRTVIISLLIGAIITAVTIITPYLNAKALESSQKRAERQVEIKMANLDQPEQQIVLPPPPPPPPGDVVQQQKYIPPVVVDSVKPEDNNQLMTADQAKIEVTNKDAIEVVQEVKEEVREENTEPEPFLSVEEMPVPPGGIKGLFKYIADNTQYPPVAKENNIQGKVYVRFCVTSKGDVDQVSVIRSVDPELDAESIRVVKTFPRFTPGKQAGKPVPVWFTVYINFQLN